MRTARRFQGVWILLTATTLATPACYTLLKHPKVDMTVYERTPDSRCTSCHAEGDVVGFFRPPGHPVYPIDDVVWNEPPWWWEDYWYFEESGPSNPTALRGFRPGTDKEIANPIIGGGPINPPPGPRIIGGDVRVKDPEDKKGEKHDEEIRDGKGGGGGGQSNEKKEEDKNRPVRPKGKEKEDG